jgi:hypothetical protein
MTRARQRRWIFACALLCAAASRAEPLRLAPLGDGPVEIPGVGNAELSGITWVGGARFLAVDDGSPRLLPLEVSLLPLDGAAGGRLQIAVGAWVELSSGRDLEGIAWRGPKASVLVTDETAHMIREHDPESGALRRFVHLEPGVRGRLRVNQGLEGITISPDGSETWIANESPLKRDDELPSARRGALVRLQRLDASFAPTGHWAYRTEPGLGFVGVVDLMLAPGGELLVLERALTGAGFAARIFAVDFRDATEVSGIEVLAEHEELRPVGKRPLWERSGGFQNFEGMALGPALADGGHLVLLVSDGGERTPPTLLPLRLTGGEAPEAPR